MICYPTCNSESLGFKGFGVQNISARQCLSDALNCQMKKDVLPPSSGGTLRNPEFIKALRAIDPIVDRNLAEQEAAEGIGSLAEFDSQTGGDISFSPELIRSLQGVTFNKGTRGTASKIYCNSIEVRGAKITFYGTCETIKMTAGRNLGQKKGHKNSEYTIYIDLNDLRISYNFKTINFQGKPITKLSFHYKFNLNDTTPAKDFDKKTILYRMLEKLNGNLRNIQEINDLKWNDPNILAVKKFIRSLGEQIEKKYGLELK
jgi:hypothetical protein